MATGQGVVGGVADKKTTLHMIEGGFLPPVALVGIALNLVDDLSLTPSLATYCDVYDILWQQGKGCSRFGPRRISTKA